MLGGFWIKGLIDSRSMFGVELEASPSSGRAGRRFWAFPGHFDPRSWTLS